MASRLVRHDVLVVSADATPEEVAEQAERQARAMAPEGCEVAFVHLHGSCPAGEGTVQWRYSFQLIPGSSADRRV